jgi:hypothetical protein
MLASHHLVSIHPLFALILISSFLPQTSQKLFVKVERSLKVSYFYGVVVMHVGISGKNCYWDWRHALVAWTYTCDAGTV